MEKIVEPLSQVALLEPEKRLILHGKEVLQRQAHYTLFATRTHRAKDDARNIITAARSITVNLIVSGKWHSDMR